MKKFTNLVIPFLFLIGCNEPEKEIVEVKRPSTNFNQANTQFTTEHIQCLYAQYSSAQFSDTTYKDAGVVMSVINDADAYRSFFACSPEITLPGIDFRSQSLLIGMNANRNIDTPVNIKKIVQTLYRNDSTSYSYMVIVAGNPTEHKSGGEWFGFTTLVPKINEPVKLTISYVFN